MWQKPIIPVVIAHIQANKKTRTNAQNANWRKWICANKKTTNALLNQSVRITQTSGAAIAIFARDLTNLLRVF
ncbi:hypothetical protein [Hyphomicrobium sulfonivorans]|uniref:hypothetical protein n=1 Tax=Hyphomicrobium sulfonivorans TaxID=121290 RepID=UPI00156E3ACE|nr:hypothetical protein [Hyphomicrobium sulfonivorans]MBI1650393.1 hypothetical protein [Hyphomicrobium sulfonivorans]